MAMFSSARLALRRAASLGAGLCRAAEDPFSRRLLHGQLLPRSFASDASPFGRDRLFPPSGSGIADMDPPENLFDGNLRQKFKSYNFVRQDNRANAQVNFNNTDIGAAMPRTNFVRQDNRANAQVNFNNTDNGAAMPRTNFLRQDNRANAQVNFNNTDNGAAMPRTATGEKLFSFREGFPFSSSRAFNHEQYSKKRDFVHVLLKRKKTFVTVTDSSGNKKTGGSAGCLEDRKGRSRLSRYASEAVAEQVGRSARKMGLTSVVMKVKGASFFKKKKKVILSFREGFGGERVRDPSPIMYIHDVTQLPHNGCGLRKQRRV